MHRFLYIVLLLGTLLPVSCSRSGRAIAEMERAEALMDSLPDSALAVMRGIDPRSLHGSEARALYALTMSRALDRNDIFVASDSIIAPAVGHYRPDRDPLRHTMTQYYLGRTLFHAGDFPRCIVAMYDGFHTATDNDLFFWKGMTARELATCFNHMRYFGEELKYDKIAYEAFKNSGRSLHTRYALMDVGLAYHNATQYDSAVIYVSQAIDSAISNHDVAMEYEAKTIMSRSCYVLERYSEAIATCESMNRCGGMNPSDSAVLGLSLIESGDTIRAKAILDNIHGKEQLLSDYILLDLQRAEGDYASALKTLTDINNSTETISCEVSNQQMIGLVADYYDVQRKAKIEELKSKQVTIMLIIVCLVMMFALFILVIQSIRKAARHKLHEKIALADELKMAYESTVDNLAASKLSIKHLVKTRYGIFNNIFSVMNECRNKELSKEKFSEIINNVIGKITPGGDEYGALEQIINDNNDNIVADFRNELPGLKDADYALFSYTILGFSVTSISILLHENNVNNVYNRKRRLKDKIAAIDSNRKNEYLAELR